ncbi:MAG: 4Fe-4S binding protein [Anaerolineales bacterium]|nr:4Fe-4S binding protein [Anaerolineales bacterium]
MYGLGILKGLSVTLKHFVNTYVDDFKYGFLWIGNKRYTPEAMKVRQSAENRGVFTVQYPDEVLQPQERFRFVPFLVYEGTDEEREYRCTACGICSKACPPQCIWIVRATNPETGRPEKKPAEFYIDIDICMNCGSCAEYCPFDAIRMDHDFELADTVRTESHIHNLQRLGKPVEYYSKIRPTYYEAEVAAEKAKAERKAKARG